MIKEEKFCIFILSYGRADYIKTYEKIKEAGYTGEIYVIVDDSDEDLNKYKKKFKSELLIFNKEEYMKKVDYMNNNKEMKSVVYARNYCMDIARKMGYKYILQMDDDFTSFDYRYIIKDKIKSKKIKNMDGIIKAFITFLKEDKISMLAFGNSSHFVGGAKNKDVMKGYKKNAFASMFLKTEDDINYIGLMNEDMNCNLEQVKNGKVVLSILRIKLNTPSSKTVEGGLTDIYIDEGKYIRDFYTFMYSPSNINIGIRKDKIILTVRANNTYPKLIDENLKKVIK